MLTLECNASTEMLPHAIKYIYESRIDLLSCGNLKISLHDKHTGESCVNISTINNLSSTYRLVTYRQHILIGYRT